MVVCHGDTSFDVGIDPDWSLADLPCQVLVLIPTVPIFDQTSAIALRIIQGLFRVFQWSYLLALQHQLLDPEYANPRRRWIQSTCLGHLLVSGSLFLIEMEISPADAFQKMVIFANMFLLAVDMPLVVILSSGLVDPDPEPEIELGDPSEHRKEDLQGGSKPVTSEAKIIEKEDLDLLAPCSICLADLLPGDDAQKLPCNHIFHTHCIAEWLQRSPFCPLRCPGSVAIATPTEERSFNATSEFLSVLPGQVDP